MASIGILCAYEKGFKPPGMTHRDTAFDGFRGLGFTAGRQIYVYEKSGVDCYIVYVPLSVRKRAVRRLGAYLASKGVRQIVADRRLNEMDRFLPKHLLAGSSEAFKQRHAPRIVRKYLKCKGLYDDTYHFAAVVRALTDENKGVLRVFAEDAKEMTLVTKQTTAVRIYVSELMHAFGIVIRISEAIPENATVVWREGEPLDLRILGKPLREVRVALPSHQALFDLPEIDTVSLADAILQEHPREPLKFTNITCS